MEEQNQTQGQETPQVAQEPSTPQPVSAQAYIGPDVVQSTTEFSEVGADGESRDYVEVVYANGFKEVMAKKMFDAVISTDPCDYTELRTKRMYPVVSEILNTLHSWDVKISEVNFVVTMIIQSINANVDKASTWAFKADENSRTMRDVDRVLQDKNEHTTVDDVIHS